MTDVVKTAYELYFGFSIDERDKSWLPKVCCNSCSRTLRGWLEESHKSMPFSMPMIWSEPQNHENDCYFCMTCTRGFSKKNKDKIVYPNVPSAKRPIPRDKDTPAPVPPVNKKAENKNISFCKYIFIFIHFVWIFMSVYRTSFT